jgi:hypothetical protein
MENTSYPQIAHFPPEKLFPAPKGCGKYSAGIDHIPPKSATTLENQTQVFFGFKFPPENNFPALFPPSKREIKRQIFVFPNGPQIPAENQNSDGKQKKQTAPYTSTNQASQTRFLISPTRGTTRSGEGREGG